MEFLLANDFSIDHMCSFGVRYLSREEEKLALKRAIEKCHTRLPVQSLEINKDDQETLEFITAVRVLIDDWLAEGEVRYDIEC